MEVAAPPRNPGKVTLVSDLAKSGQGRAVPAAGAVRRRRRRGVQNAEITVKPVTLEPDVKSVLTKVELGRVDAGVVYVTDVWAAGGKVNGVTISDSDNASTLYPIALSTTQATSRRPVLRRLRAVLGGPAGPHRRGIQAALTCHPEPPRGRSARRRTDGPERARRAARGGASRSVPAPAVPALIAVAFLVLPLVGLLIRAPWRDLGAAPAGPMRPGARSLAVDRRSEHGDLAGHRRAAGLGAGPERLPGAAAPAGAGHPAAGAAAGGRRGRAAAGLRAERRSSASTWTAGSGSRCRSRPRAWSWPRPSWPCPSWSSRSRARCAGRPGPRGGRGHARRRDGWRSSAASPCRWSRRPGRGRGAVLGAGARRVRRDDHLRRQLPRPDADDAAGRLLRPRDRPASAIVLSLVLLVVSIVVLVSLRDHWLRGGSAS